MKVWSISPFLNELDLLELRLRELDDVVDVFVLAESPVTFRGDAKPLWFAEHRERFAPWLDRIRYLVTTYEEPVPFQAFGEPERWRRENGQRAALQLALGDVALGDIVVLSDADEIPRPETIRAFASRREAIWQPRLPMYLYRFGLRIDAPQQSVIRLFRGELLRGHTPEMIRRKQVTATDPPDPGRPAAYGWHFSYFGGIEAVRYKVRQAAHPEEDIPDWVSRDNLRRCIAVGEDHRRNRSHRVVWDSDDLPVTLAERDFPTLWDPLVHPACFTS